MNNKLTLPAFFGLLQLSLSSQHAHPASAQQLKLKDLRLVNRGGMLLCEFYTSHSTTTDIKSQLACIIRSLNSLLSAGLHLGITPGYFSVAAFDEHGLKVMTVISNKEAAVCININFIHWLRASIFVDNTADYRNARAKKIVFEIENILKDMIKNVYKSKYGLNWWALSIEWDIAKKSKQHYLLEFGREILNGDILIGYIEFSDFRQIIFNGWHSFAHVFPDRYRFEKNVNSLERLMGYRARGKDISKRQLTQLNIVLDFFKTHAVQAYRPGVTTSMSEIESGWE